MLILADELDGHNSGGAGIGRVSICAYFIGESLSNGSATHHILTVSCSRQRSLSERYSERPIVVVKRAEAPTPLQSVWP